MPETAFVTPLQLRYIDGKTWELTSNFVVVSATLGTILVPGGFKTDFNSIPRGLWNILPPDQGGHAGVVHDYLYQTGRLGTRILTRGEADACHREFALFDGLPKWKVNLIYAALRVGGFRVWNRYRARDISPLEPAQ